MSPRPAGPASAKRTQLDRQPPADGPAPGWFRWVGADLELAVRVQPRAATDGFGEIEGGRVKIRLTAPPVDGKANAALLAFLGDAFGVPKSRVSLLAGEAGRNKRLLIRAPHRLPLPVTGPP